MDARVYENPNYFNTNTFLGGAFVQFGDANIFLRNEINFYKRKSRKAAEL